MDTCDRFVETQHCKYMLHSTVRIKPIKCLITQNQIFFEYNQQKQNCHKNTKLKKRSCSYSSSDLTTTPNRKKPTFVTHGMLELNDARQSKYE